MYSDWRFIPRKWSLTSAHTVGYWFNFKYVFSYKYSNLCFRTDAYYPQHNHTSAHTHLLTSPLRSANSSPSPYQRHIISTYCIVANGCTIPSLIGCLSDFVFVLLCPCLSINPNWLQSSQPGEWIRQESDNWLPRWGRSFISVGLPGLIGTA